MLIANRRVFTEQPWSGIKRERDNAVGINPLALVE